MALVALTVASAAVTAVLSGLRTWVARIMVAGTVLVSLVLVQQPDLAAWLHLEPLHGDDWVIASAGGLLVAAVTALRWLPGLRTWRPHRRKRAPRPPGL
jgi:Ca2+-transporting ATPase